MKISVKQINQIVREQVEASLAGREESLPRFSPLYQHLTSIYRNSSLDEDSKEKIFNLLLSALGPTRGENVEQKYSRYLPEKNIDRVIDAVRELGQAAAEEDRFSAALALRTIMSVFEDLEDEDFIRKTVKENKRTQITVRELRQMIREAIREQVSFQGADGSAQMPLPYPLQLIRQFLVGDKTLYFQINGITNGTPRETLAGIPNLIQQALLEQRQDSTALFAVDVIQGIMSQLQQSGIQIPQNQLTQMIANDFYRNLTQANARWGGNASDPRGVVVVTIPGGGSLQSQWLENFRLKAETKLKQVPGLENISIRLTQAG